LAARSLRAQADYRARSLLSTFPDPRVAEPLDLRVGLGSRDHLVGTSTGYVAHHLPHSRDSKSNDARHVERDSDLQEIASAH
jgi:hypothetical protein